LKLENILENNESVETILKKGKAGHNSWYVGFYDGYNRKKYNEKKADKHYKVGYNEGETERDWEMEQEETNRNSQKNQ